MMMVMMMKIVLNMDLSRGILTRKGIKELKEKGRDTSEELIQLDNYLYLKTQQTEKTLQRYDRQMDDLIFALNIKKELAQDG